MFIVNFIHENVLNYKLFKNFFYIFFDFFCVEKQGFLGDIGELNIKNTPQNWL